MQPDQVIAADLTYVDGRFRAGVRIGVRDGRIISLDTNARPTLNLEREAILPGFVNAHSHAFQRGLRGLGESYPEGAGSFWTWRSGMYNLASTITPERMLELASQAFSEMRRAGITAVAEFHYLHHSPDSVDYAMDEVILTAAKAVGIRLLLINTCYHTTRPGVPLSGPQQRFDTRPLTGFWQQMDRLTGRLDENLHRLGVAAHSLRAVDLDDLTALHREAASRGMPFHMHLEEQRLEIEQCLDYYGRTPVALVNAELQVSELFTAVHCTHTTPADLRSLVDAGARICICPTTEGNLGDGIPDLSHLDSPTPICLGTDSNNRISMLEEMRWLEYGQRLKQESRGVLTRAEETAPVLLETAAANGAAALGLEAGVIEPGRLADFLTIDLNHPSLRGADADTLPAALVFGCDNEVILRTCVGGGWRLHRPPNGEVPPG